MKIFVTIFFISLILLTGCDSLKEENDEGKSTSPIGTPCILCVNVPLKDRILNKTCECYTYKTNISYTIDFGCNKNIYSCEGLTFESKKKLALIADNWYCICNETVEKSFCEQENECKARIYTKIINRKTEYVWNY